MKVVDCIPPWLVIGAVILWIGGMLYGVFYA